MRAVVAGPDRGLGDALAARGVDVARVSGLITREGLIEAGIAEAALFVLTDVEEATSVPIALDENPGLRVVVYDHETMPEFVRAQVDLAIDPDVMPVDAVAEELAR